MSNNGRGKISTGTRTTIFQRDGFRCRRCGRGPDECALVVDHITPVALGGTNELANLQTLCCDCNGGKRDQPPHEHDLKGHSRPGALPRTDPIATLIGCHVLRPVGAWKEPCAVCGEKGDDYWRGRIVASPYLGSYLVEWHSWLDGSVTHSGLVELKTMHREDWRFYPDRDDHDAACRWVISQHDHKGLYRWANYGEGEPRRLSVSPPTVSGAS